jgi:hypothetical protein
VTGAFQSRPDLSQPAGWKVTISQENKIVQTEADDDDQMAELD